MNRDSEFAEVLRQLDAPAKRHLAETMPWPFNGMICDVTAAIEAKANYLAALGLVCYIEICGRMMFHAGNRAIKGWRCFKTFLDYIGAGGIMDHKVQFGDEMLYFHDVVRNGLAHEYFMKAEEGGVAMISNDPDANRSGVLIRSSGQVVLVVVPLFHLFCRGLEKAKATGLIG